MSAPIQITPEQGAGKHTPGPWVVGWNEGLTGPTCASAGGPFCGGRDWPYRPISRGLETIALVPQQDGSDAMEANARLIAAAPDGYSLARLVVSSASVDGLSEGDEISFAPEVAQLIWAKAKRLLAKAEGRTNG